MLLALLQLCLFWAGVQLLLRLLAGRRNYSKREVRLRWDADHQRRQSRTVLPLTALRREDEGDGDDAGSSDELSDDERDRARSASSGSVLTIKPLSIHFQSDSLNHHARRLLPFLSASPKPRLTSNGAPRRSSPGSNTRLASLLAAYFDLCVVLVVALGSTVTFAVISGAVQKLLDAAHARPAAAGAATAAGTGGAASVLVPREGSVGIGADAAHARLVPLVSTDRQPPLGPARWSCFVRAHILPSPHKIPGLTLPLAHVPVLLAALLVAQLIHEVLGHAVATTVVCANSCSPKKSDDRPLTQPSTTSTSSSRHTISLPRMTLGLLYPLPGLLAFAYVRLPAFAHLRSPRWRLRTRDLYRIVAGGVGANALSLLLFLLALGPTAPAGQGTIYPTAAAPLLAVTNRLDLGVPSLRLGAWARAACFSADPLGAAVGSGSSTTTAQGGLRIVKLDAQAPSMLAGVLQSGDIITAVDDVSFLGDARAPPAGADRLARWAKHLTDPEAPAKEKGWCFERKAWDALLTDPCAGKAEAKGGAGEVCFEPLAQNGTEPSPPRSTKATRVMQADVPRCSTSSECKAASDLCIRPTQRTGLVRLTLLDRDQPRSRKNGPSSMTLYLSSLPNSSAPHTTLLRSLTLSPYALRAPLRWLVPGYLADAWLMLLDLLARYWLLASAGLVLLNALPLPGLDGDQMLQLIARLDDDAAPKRSGATGAVPSDLEEGLRRRTTASSAQRARPKRLRRAMYRMLQLALALSLIMHLL